MKRPIIALGLLVYAWLMLALDVAIHAARGVPDAGAQALGQFRRQVLGTALLGLGALAALVGLILAATALRARPRLSVSALAVAAAWGALATWLWTTGRV